LTQQSEKIISETKAWLLNKCFMSLRLFDEAFLTFHVRFITIINTSKITNVFVKKFL